MLYWLSLLVENAVYIATFLFSIAAAYAINKQAKGAPGANLLLIGFFMYALYGLLSFTGPGFTGSFFRDFSKVGVLNSQNFVYFVSFAMRFGMVLIIAGIYRLAVSRQSKA
jgi:hypothetical protein